MAQIVPAVTVETVDQYRAETEKIGTFARRIHIDISDGDASRCRDQPRPGNKHTHVLEVASEPLPCPAVGKPGDQNDGRQWLLSGARGVIGVEGQRNRSTFLIEARRHPYRVGARQRVRHLFFRNRLDLCVLSHVRLLG